MVDAKNAVVCEVTCGELDVAEYIAKQCNDHRYWQIYNEFYEKHTRLWR